MDMDFISSLMGGILQIAFFIFFIGVGVFLFTKKGRNFGRHLAFGEVIEDYGIIGEEFGGKQKYRLLKCEKNHEIFYVLEVQSSGFGSFSVNMIKLNHETVQNLRSILR